MQYEVSKVEFYKKDRARHEIKGYFCVNGLRCILPGRP